MVNWTKKTSLLACTGVIAILAITAVPAAARTSDKPAAGLPDLDKALSTIVERTGFDLDEYARDQAKRTATRITYRFQSNEKDVVTAVHSAWRFTFPNVSIEWTDGRAYSRDYDVLLDTTVSMLLSVRSPLISDSVYDDSREWPSLRHPQFDAIPAQTRDSTVITFREALLAFSKGNPFQASQLEATIISYNDMFVDSVLAWDIVVRDLAIGAKPRLHPPRIVVEEFGPEEEKEGPETVPYVRQFISATTGNSLSYRIVSSERPRD